MHTTSAIAAKTYLAWQFSNVIPGTFKRNKKQFAHLDYPILAPLPPLAAKTKPIEECSAEGPFIYFVHDGAGDLCYVGKSKEKSVIKRWVRPGIGGPLGALLDPLHGFWWQCVQHCRRAASQ